MNVCLLCSDVEVPLLGDEGCSVKLRQFADTLVDAGHEVTVICSWLGEGADWPTAARVHELGPDGPDWAALQADPAVAGAHLGRDLHSLVFNHWLLRQGRALLADSPPDAVYERYALFGWAGAMLARELGARHALEVNGPLCQEQDGYSEFVLTDAASALEAHAFQAAGAVVAVSPWVRDFAIERGAAAEDVHLLPNGVAPLFAGSFDGRAVRGRLGLGDRPVVGYVGSFQHWHDVRGLVEAFAGLRALEPRAALLLVGHGPGREAAEAAVAEHGIAGDVVFTGHVQPADVPDHIAAMDVPVVPYRATADFYFSPLKLFESMAVGRPTVAAAIGHLGEAVEDGTTGVLYQPGSAAALRDAVVGLVRDRERAERIGAAGRAVVLARHTMAANAARALELARVPRAPAALAEAL